MTIDVKKVFSLAFPNGIGLDDLERAAELKRALVDYAESAPAPAARLEAAAAVAPFIPPAEAREVLKSKRSTVAEGYDLGTYEGRLAYVKATLKAKPRTKLSTLQRVLRVDRATIRNYLQKLGIERAPERNGAPQDRTPIRQKLQALLEGGPATTPELALASGESVAIVTSLMQDCFKRGFLTRELSPIKSAKGGRMYRWTLKPGADLCAVGDRKAS